MAYNCEQELRKKDKRIAELNILANGNQHTIDALQEMLFKQDAEIKRLREELEGK